MKGVEEYRRVMTILYESITYAYVNPGHLVDPVLHMSDLFTLEVRYLIKTVNPVCASGQQWVDDVTIPRVI